MIQPGIPENESERLNALNQYGILDTLPEKEYDDITYLASYICKTPISLISLVDDKRQWFKSSHGIDVNSTSKELAFCAHAINDHHNILVVPDSRKDERFHDNPMVTDEPHVIFYAGVPLVNPEGYPLGTLCVIDNKPNKLTREQIDALNALSNQVIKLLELRKNSRELWLSNKELEIQNNGLMDFAKTAAHDIRSPLSSITMLTDLLMTQYSANIEEEGLKLIEYISESSQKLTQLIDGILQYSKDTNHILNNKENIDLNQVINDTIRLIDASGKVDYHIDIQGNPVMYVNKTALKQVLINLLSNSIKYNDKEVTKISIKVSEDEKSVKINIIDNGPGIKEEDQERIFRIFETTSNRDKTGASGTGIGLATVKSIIEGLGGQITVSSEIGKGSNFECTISKN